MTPLTRTAINATLHCLTGCAIGEVLGMVLGTAFGWHDGLTIAVAIILAFTFGYALTAYSVLKAGMSIRVALGLAFASDTASIATMEIIDNAIIVVIPGALHASLTSGLFWGSLVFSLAVAFVVAVPVNRWLIARGKGHALVHGHHH